MTYILDLNYNLINRQPLSPCSHFCQYTYWLSVPGLSLDALNNIISRLHIDTVLLLEHCP